MSTQRKPRKGDRVFIDGDPDKVGTIKIRVMPSYVVVYDDGREVFVGGHRIQGTEELLDSE